MSTDMIENTLLGIGVTFLDIFLFLYLNRLQIVLNIGSNIQKISIQIFSGEVFHFFAERWRFAYDCRK